MDRDVLFDFFAHQSEVVAVKLIWVRHGLTAKNASGRYIGHTDEPMNETGRAQIARLAAKLSTMKVSCAFTSDLSRCVETAAILCKTWGIEAVPCAALRELNFGKWEGKTYAEIAGEDCDHLWRWYDDPLCVAPPEGETVMELARRVDAFLHKLIHCANEAPTVLLVSHGGPIRWFLSKWVAGDVRSFFAVEGLSHGAALIATRQGGRFRAETVGGEWA
jgi:broad specificity phosphatase PhoE